MKRTNDFNNLKEGDKVTLLACNGQLYKATMKSLINQKTGDVFSTCEKCPCMPSNCQTSGWKRINDKVLIKEQPFIFTCNACFYNKTNLFPIISNKHKRIINRFIKKYNTNINKKENEDGTKMV